MQEFEQTVAAGMNCTYCNVRQADTADHIFPQFLGGSRTVPACSVCNNTLFGGAFEGRLSHRFQPLVVWLAAHGYTPPRPAVWRSAFEREGASYDLRSDGTASRSKPLVQQDADGNLVRVIARTRGELRGILKRTHIEGVVTENSETIKAPKEIELAWELDDDVKRLGLKIAVGAAAAAGIDSGSLLSEVARSYLVEGPSVTLTPPVMVDYRRHPFLEQVSPPFAHRVHVEADPDRRLCHAIVGIYAFFNMYILLNDAYNGPRIGLAAALDGMERVEDWSVSPDRFERALEHQSTEDVLAGMVRQQHRLNANLMALDPGASPIPRTEQSIAVPVSYRLVLHVFDANLMGPPSLHLRESLRQDLHRAFLERWSRQDVQHEPGLIDVTLAGLSVRCLLRRSTFCRPVTAEGKLSMTPDGDSKMELPEEPFLLPVPPGNGWIEITDMSSIPSTDVCEEELIRVTFG
ncbi:MAG: hypothetical protein ACYCOU_06850 [Sulfobacillus sp.]